MVNSVKLFCFQELLQCWKYAKLFCNFWFKLSNFSDLLLLDLNSFSADTEGANEIEGSAGKGIEIPCKGASFFPRMILCNSAKLRE